MKNLIRTTPLIFCAAAILISCGEHRDEVGILGNNDTQKDTQGLGAAPGPVYETAEEIRAMPPSKATVVQRAPCFVYLRTEERTGFYIGSPGSTADVGYFLAVLKDGQTYSFPNVFLEYEKTRKAEGP